MPQRALDIAQLDAFPTLIESGIVDPQLVTPRVEYQRPTRWRAGDRGGIGTLDGDLSGHDVGAAVEGHAADGTGCRQLRPLLHRRPEMLLTHFSHDHHHLCLSGRY